MAIQATDNIMIDRAGVLYKAPVSQLPTGGGATSTVVAGRTYRSTNQAIPAGAGFTLVSFDTVGMAVGGTFFSAGTPTEAIIPEDGVYQIDFEGTGEGTTLVVTWEIQVNLVGGGVIGGSQFMAPANATAPLDNGATRQFTAGQRVTIGIKHSNATALNLLNEGNHSPDIRITKIGGAKGDAGSAGVPAGATGQIQFNNANAFTGDADLIWDASANSLILGGTDTSITLQAITNEPAAPSAGRVKLYTKSYAGKMLPKVKGPSGLDFPLQIALWGNKVYRWQSTNATAGVWEGTVGAGSGTFSRQLPVAGGTLYATVARARWANVVTTLNQVLGQRNTEAVFFRGSVAGQGGFFFQARLGFDVWTNGGRFFAGMHTGTTVVSADPSALNNTVGFCIDAADAGAISFLTRGTAATKAATGFTAVSGKGYDVYIFCAPNSAQYEWRIVDINTGVVATGLATLNLPTNTVMQTAGVLASNAALTTVTSVQLGCDMIYAETDY